MRFIACGSAAGEYWWYGLSKRQCQPSLTRVYSCIDRTVLMSDSFLVEVLNQELTSSRCEIWHVVPHAVFFIEMNKVARVHTKNTHMTKGGTRVFSTVEIKYTKETVAVFMLHQQKPRPFPPSLNINVGCTPASHARGHNANRAPQLPPSITTVCLPCNLGAPLLHLCITMDYGCEDRVHFPRPPTLWKSNTSLFF